MEQLTTADLSWAGPFHEKAAVAERKLAAGNFRDAVEIAKDLHKKLAVPQASDLLLRAYLGRIGQMQRQGMDKEWRALAEVVVAKFPAARARLESLQEDADLLAGRFEVLLTRLARPELPDSERAALETKLRLHLTDPCQITASPSLPETHPLRLAAAAATKAFTAVTSGPVTDDMLLLPEVSRRSPLAPWKLLIRAIALYYRGDADGCRQALEALPVDSPVNRLRPALQALLTGNRKPAGSPEIVTLSQAVLAVGNSRLHNAARQLEEEFRREDGYVEDLQKACRNLLDTCAADAPERLDDLLATLAVRLQTEHLSAGEAKKSLGRTAPRNARFWNLLARRHTELAEHATQRAYAVVPWELYRRHAVAEGQLVAFSPQEGLLYGYMAGLLKELSGKALARLSAQLDQGEMADYLLSGDYYRGQSDARRACAPKDAAELQPCLEPDWLFEQATARLPDAGLFQDWLQWTRGHRGADECEAVARLWSTAHPHDARPWLRLAEAAEDRNAYTKALKFLAQARQADPLAANASPVLARIHTFAFLRHVKKGQLHLTETDLKQLTDLPLMREGDRPMLLKVMRTLTVPEKEATEAWRELNCTLTPTLMVLTQLMLDVLRKAGGLTGDPAGKLRMHNPAVVELPAALARLVVATRPLGLVTATDAFLQSLVGHVADRLEHGNPGLTAAQLLLLGRFVGEHRPTATHARAAFQISRHGLALSDADPAAFLAVRAQAFDTHTEQGLRDAVAALRAARVLARLHRDPALMEHLDQVEARLDADDVQDLERYGRREDHEWTEERARKQLELERQCTSLPDPAPAPRRKKARRTNLQRRDEDMERELEAIEDEIFGDDTSLEDEDLDEDDELDEDPDADAPDFEDVMYSVMIEMMDKAVSREAACKGVPKDFRSTQVEVMMRMSQLAERHPDTDQETLMARLFQDHPELQARCQTVIQRYSTANIVNYMMKLKKAFDSVQTTCPDLADLI